MNMGEGDDEVTLEATTANTGKLDLVLGEGNDKVTVTAAFANVGDQDDFEDSLIVISDFDVNDDTLDISALTSGTIDTITNTEQADISAQTSLEAALDTAAGYTTGYSVFDYDGDAYVLASGGATLANDDGLIKLTGVSSADLDASAFVV